MVCIDMILLLMSFTSIFVWFYFCFFFKQKTAYEMRISDWSSDVCSSDLAGALTVQDKLFPLHNAMFTDAVAPERPAGTDDIGITAEGMAGERSEERRVGKECVSTCRSRWSPYH